MCTIVATPLRAIVFYGYGSRTYRPCSPVYASAIPLPGWVLMGCVTSTRHARISVCSRRWEQDIRPCPGTAVRHAASMRRRAASVADDTRARIDARRAYREGLRGPGDAAEPSSGGLFLCDDTAACPAPPDAPRKGMQACQRTARSVLCALSCTRDSGCTMGLSPNLLHLTLPAWQPRVRPTARSGVASLSLYLCLWQCDQFAGFQRGPGPPPGRYRSV